MLSQGVQQQDMLCTGIQEDCTMDATFYSAAGQFQNLVSVQRKLPRLSQLGGAGQVQVEQFHLTVYTQGQGGLSCSEQH